ncbi:rRNA-processing protein UTP23 homolog [Penaeus japonicus]|uniref:rRNA-processing protein UTP23 homolog n=1 Tax=Penaeus japonicus TaxID=27405 RepID=UPI001C70DFE0|nr:rRNA-processing protein UTP23 homolog [Penaeus japonicus]XP_042860534.1 rRNA-processing protein UTP23 homolog [Penaeus japonicus]XP_042860535.1 rRNA-processing protein UTP23 homolog [Penaeus japonicus]
MKIRRQKKAQKILGFYQHNFDIRPPYTVLLDGTFCYAAIEGKVKIAEDIPKYLGSLDTKLITTQCIILEVEQLRKLKRDLHGPYMIVKQFPVHVCGHEGKPVPASSCIKSLLKKENPKKYIIASQDNELRTHIHECVTGTPVLYLHRSAPTLEKPSEKSQADPLNANKTITTHEEKTLQSLKRKLIGEEEVEPERRKKKKKNPNPLSCKKSKKVKKPQQQQQQEMKEGKSKRKRKKHKKPGAVHHHIQQEAS